jgi:hypothetical protein
MQKAARVVHPQVLAIPGRVHLENPNLCKATEQDVQAKYAEAPVLQTQLRNMLRTT